MTKIQIKIGDFIREHLDNIVKECERDYSEVLSLQDAEYSKQYLGLASNFSFFKKVEDIDEKNDKRYWKDKLSINGKKYRACSQFGGGKEKNGKTKSQLEGEKFFYYLKNKSILLDKYHVDYIKFIIGNGEVIKDNTDLNSVKHFNIKNIILYGSPGVGKTHNTNKLIKLIESGESEKKIFREIKENKKEPIWLDEDTKSRTKFVTFHQSFGYEDFIEGFRPNEEGKIELVDGIFKNICKDAQDNLDNSKSDKVFNFDRFLNDFIQKVEAEEEFEIDTNLTIEVKKKTNGEFQSFKIGGRVKSQTLTKDTIKRDFELFINEKIKNYQDIKPTYESQSIYHGNAPYYFKLYEAMETYLNATDLNYESEKSDLKNYYLVIDEINRGNISKIFGELITLIEEDKRDKLEVTLPYSKQPFKIPSNLYMIGTMNSSDKSIALIDIALRRRFTFLKMKPNAELVENSEAKALFVKLNEHIRKSHLGEDYQIGHSYFMGIENNEDLEFVWDYKIKPLLEEYFYGDKEGLDEVLGLK